VKGFSESTLRVREIYIRLFLRWCEQNGIVLAGEVPNQVLSRFQEHLLFQRKTDGQQLSVSPSNFL
jgi:integrase/recombinase XerD